MALDVSAPDSDKPAREQYHKDPVSLSDPMPKVCTTRDVCRILRMSESQFYNLRSQGRFPIPEMEPPIDDKPRFRGCDVQAYLDGDLKRPRRKR